jgi:hypothetical protein
VRWYQCGYLARRAADEDDRFVAGAEREGNDGLGMCALVGVGSKQIVQPNVANGVKEVLNVRAFRRVMQE